MTISNFNEFKKKKKKKKNGQEFYSRWNEFRIVKIVYCDWEVMASRQNGFDHFIKLFRVIGDVWWKVSDVQ